MVKSDHFCRIYRQRNTPFLQMNTNDKLVPDSNRRDFLKGGSMATLMTMLGGIELVAPAARAADIDKLIAFQVKLGVIGMGPWGRDNILHTLARIKEAQVVAVCDHYPASLKKGAAAAPGAEAVDDYRKVLDNKDIQAVVVVTPSHQHKEIVIAALQAGKHVYCEAPMAASIEDARAIARAARDAKKQVFQVGLQQRSEPQRYFLLSFIRSGAMGKNLMARAQWNKKQPWRFPSPNPDREKEINWRLRGDVSSGLMGEIGVHQHDSVSWYLGARPTSVTGFGSLT